MSESTSKSYQFIANTTKKLAQTYVQLKKPTVVAVAGSVGKTSSKLMLAHLLSDKRVSCMDDSYNNGLGLYLSVFERKIPTKLHSPLAWVGMFGSILLTFLKRGPEILIVEYGIDHPGDMDDMVAFIRPDVSFLTAVTPEHMEFMKTLDGVADEETKVLRAARQFGVYNADNVDQKYVPSLEIPLFSYGSSSDNEAYYSISEWTKKGARISVNGAELSLRDVTVQFISEPLIRQLVGAALLAQKLGVAVDTIEQKMRSATPAASRMRVFDGVNGSTIIDDTTNFSPDAGVEAIKALKRIPAGRHIAILGNMHELGEYIAKGYADVAKEFVEIDVLALVGDLSIDNFGPMAKKLGFIEGKTLFTYPTSVEAGIDFRDTLQADDVVLIKGPFGGFYLEEAVKKLLRDESDSQYLTRQSTFWQEKKRALYGDLYDQ